MKFCESKESKQSTDYLLYLLIDKCSLFNDPKKCIITNTYLLETLNL